MHARGLQQSHAPNTTNWTRPRTGDMQFSSQQKLTSVRWYIETETQGHTSVSHVLCNIFGRLRLMFLDHSQYVLVEGIKKIYKSWHRSILCRLFHWSYGTNNSKTPLDTYEWNIRTTPYATSLCTQVNLGNFVWHLTYRGEGIPSSTTNTSKK